MKRSELILTFVQVPLDFTALILAGWTAYAVRFSDYAVGLKTPVFEFRAEWYVSLVALMALAWLLIFAAAGLYTVDANRKFGADVGKIFFACCTGLAGVTVFIFFRGELFNSRFIVLAAWLLAVVFVIVSHLLVRAIKSVLYRHGIGSRQTVLIGKNGTVGALLAAMNEQKGLGYQVIKRFETFNADVRRKLDDLIRRQNVDEIVMASTDINKKAALECVDWCSQHHVTFKYSADFFTTLSTNVNVATLAGVPIIELRRTRLDGWGSIIKWFMDYLLTLLLLALTAPLMALTALAIRLESGGPVIFKNERVGLNGKTFTTFKFRSMHQKYSIGTQFGNQKKALAFEQELIKKQSIKQGPLYKIQNDPRVTRVGRFIRRWSIDELPQFFNVLNGTMSLIGPRPHQPREVSGYQPQHRITFAIKPGITGLAQISGRSDLAFEDEARLDAFYIENWSLLMDLAILLKTPFVLFKKRKAL